MLLSYRSLKLFKYFYSHFFALLLILNTTSLLAFESASWLEDIDNLRFAIDMSARGQYNINSNHLSNIDSLGLDLHKVFTLSDGRDIATLVFQGYLTKLVNVEKYPSFYKDKDDLKFICRICNINFSLLDRGALNIRIGHFETPFGLEYNLDTNGTLRQYSNGRDLGGKLDWGMAFNGKASWGGGYELAFSRGSGVDWSDNYSTYIISGRVEKTFGYSSFLGFSTFYGYLTMPNTKNYIDRTRIGLDGNTQVGPLAVLGEFSIGKDDDTELINSLFEMNIQNNTEKLLGYFQFKTTSHQFINESWDTMLQSSLGVRYTPDRNWVLSGQWTYDIKAYELVKRASSLGIQVRYRF